MTSYRLALPHPWERIPVGDGSRQRVEEIVENSLRHMPDELPPDQVAQARIKLTEMMMTQLREAQDSGAIDFYLPAQPVQGVTLSASFVVSTLIPDALPAEEGMAGQVLASLIAGPDGSRAVTVGDTVWARTESLIDRAADEVVGEDLRARKVEYITALPSDERRWIIVTFTTLGEGDPNSEFSLLMVELFDAIMSTWRWTDSA